MLLNKETKPNINEWVREVRPVSLTILYMYEECLNSLSSTKNLWNVHSIYTPIKYYWYIISRLHLTLPHKKFNSWAENLL